MNVAVTYENEQVFQHFGHTPAFKVYSIDDGKVTGSEVVNTGEAGHGALAGFLQDRSITVLICGGIGGGARTALTEAGIELYPGVSGKADEIIENFIAGTLDFDPDTMCSHHGADHVCHQ
ncbi:MAG: NifB/NifX family molybdenum-iron cluster-binding protein [Eubacteriaceae bacterium]|nr:NifB/NifX family molybdenum-iron cluster-binding protein [Eubacteriaceae bacterium]